MQYVPHSPASTSGDSDLPQSSLHLRPTGERLSRLETQMEHLIEHDKLSVAATKALADRSQVHGLRIRDMEKALKSLLEQKKMTELLIEAGKWTVTVCLIAAFLLGKISIEQVQKLIESVGKFGHG
jgi:hypothetical protein